jgi:hypothetical protein
MKIRELSLYITFVDRVHQAVTQGAQFPVDRILLCRAWCSIILRQEWSGYETSQGRPQHNDIFFHGFAP